ncbi:MAG: hypothetical protein ACOX9C_06435 [Kiritimatiellia bacterium]
MYFYGNFYGNRTRDHGENQPWMATALDFGDGTYTLGTQADHGVAITLNGRRKRLLAAPSMPAASS